VIPARTSGDVRVLAARVARLRLALRQPLRTPSGFLHHREVRLLTIEREDGFIGFGEASVVDWLGGPDQANAEDALGLLVTRIASDHPRASTLLAESFDQRLPGAVRSALQTSLLDAEARAQGLPLSQLLGANTRASLPVSALLAARDPDELAEEAAKLAAHGFRCFKVKVGFKADEDLRRLRALRRVLGDDADLRLDANGAWIFAEAATRLRELRDLAPDFIEEPLDDQPDRLERSRELRALTRVALDETIRSGSDLAAAIEARAADVLVLKLERVGGPLPALALARRAFEAGLRVVFTDSIESVVGRAATPPPPPAAYSAAEHPAPPAAGARPNPDATPAEHRPEASNADDAPGEALGLGGLFLLDEKADVGPWWRGEGPGLGVDANAGPAAVPEIGE
jgi:o-succinylbenzoate synthase